MRLATPSLHSVDDAAFNPPQYCNHGTLGDAVDRGWLLNRRDRASGPNMLAVLHTAMVGVVMLYRLVLAMRG